MTKRVAIIGGGIIGLAVARKVLQESPGTELYLYEKESRLGMHQSGRNSGVLHCGLYYQPGSLKAKLAVEGIKSMVSYCESNGIDHDVCGKVVVAKGEKEEKELDRLRKRGLENGLSGLKYLSDAELKKREPNIDVTKALLVPEEGIVSYKQVMATMAREIEAADGKIVLKTKPVFISSDGVETTLDLGSNQQTFDLVISCSGVYSDQVYEAITGQKSPVKIVPFRGEYYMFKEAYADMVNHLVYPVPDPEFPFLGVHFTRLITGEREFGPNAVLALKKEGYNSLSFSAKDAISSLSYPGLRKFIQKNFSFSMDELKSSLSKSKFLEKGQKLMPELRSEMLEKGTAGIRAQAMNANGDLLMDFNIVQENGQVHVLNAPSPGATSSIAIASYVYDNYLQSLF